jgi:hypothetical protein
LFTNSTPSALHLTKATSSVSNLTAKIETVVDGRAYRILVKTVPVLGAGQLNATIHLETDSAAKPSFDIPVSVSVLAALTVAPQALTIQGPSAAPVTRYIIIRSGSVQTFKILSVEPPAPGITVETSPFGNQGTRITLSNIIPTAELNGKNVKITTDVPAMNEILVPFSVVQ